jgi:glycosyltransferase involved in cell wall biosynthesis
MRLTWLSNSPWTPHGYGVQTGLFTTRLIKEGYPIAVISNYGHQGPPINWNGVQVFGNSFHPYCQDIMHSHSVTWKADALLTLLDVQVMELEGLQGTKWVPWFPIDHATIPPIIYDKIKQADARITMSKHASKEMDKTGLDYEYVPCAVDTKVYKPLPMAESREAMQLPLDKFIVGMVAMNKGNPSRKAFHQNMMAFAALKQKYGDCVMYLHTGDGTRQVDGLNLVDFCKALGLKYGYAFHESAKNADVIFADQYGMALGYDSPMMAQLYSSMDVHLLVTMGEGFGIPIVEAQACGTPVIVGDWTSMSELCFSGWKVAKEDAEPIFTNLNAFQYLPHPGAIAEKLEAAYQMRGNPDYRKRARAGAQLYDADRILQHNWLPALKKVEAKLQETKPKDRLAVNLDMMRVSA